MKIWGRSCSMKGNLSTAAQMGLWEEFFTGNCPSPRATARIHDNCCVSVDLFQDKIISGLAPQAKLKQEEARDNGQGSWNWLPSLVTWNTNLWFLYKNTQTRQVLVSPVSLICCYLFLHNSKCVSYYLKLNSFSTCTNCDKSTFCTSAVSINP